MNATERLGIITDFDSAREKRDDFIARRYRLLDVARELLPDHRVAGCLHVPIPGKVVEVWKEIKSGHAHLHGVGRCGSAWVCPVCATKIAIGRADEIEGGIKAAQVKGLIPVFITFTASHQRDDALVSTLTKQKAALRFMRASRRWGKLKAIYGITGQIDAWEITWGFSAGWHPHNHGLYFVKSAPEVEGLENELFDLWSHELSKQGLSCNRSNGVKVLHGQAAVAGYMAKWGLQSELTSPEKRGRKDNYTPFQLLSLYEHGEAWAGGLYQEFSNVTKGLSMIRWSRGLRDVLGLRTELTDQALAESEESDGSVLMLPLTRDEYKKIIYSGRRGVIGEMLMVAELGLPELIAWLSIFGISPRDAFENSLHNTS